MYNAEFKLGEDFTLGELMALILENKACLQYETWGSKGKEIKHPSIQSFPARIGWSALQQTQMTAVLIRDLVNNCNYNPTMDY